MRRFGKVDDTQKIIVKVLIKAGATVQSLASVHHGCPDLLVGHWGRNYLFECKSPVKTSHRRPKELTPEEAEWHKGWKGTVHTVEGPIEALRIIGIVQ